MSSPAPPCPLCGQHLAQARTVNICHACHASVVADGVVVSSTGEFRLDQIMAAVEGETAQPMAPTHEASEVSCTWCGKPEAEVRKLLSRGSANICNECVALCAAVMTAELGDDYG